MTFDPMPNPDAEIHPAMPAAMREPRKARGSGELEQGFDEYQCWYEASEGEHP